MGSVSKKTAIDLPTDRQLMCNNDLLRLLADQRGHTLSEMIAHFHVTLTAIRYRLSRLMRKELVTRQRVDATVKRGRPQHLYFITSTGEEALAEAADEGAALQKPRPQPIRACHETTAGRAEDEIMARILKKAAAKPITERQRRSDNDLLRLLADKHGRSVKDMAEHFSVTPPAIYARLVRLMLAQAVTRKREDIAFGQGMTRHLYYITDQGVKALAQVESEPVVLQQPKPWLIWG